MRGEGWKAGAGAVAVAVELWEQKLWVLGMWEQGLWGLGMWEQGLWGLGMWEQRRGRTSMTVLLTMGDN